MNLAKISRENNKIISYEVWGLILTIVAAPLIITQLFLNNVILTAVSLLLILSSLGFYILSWKNIIKNNS
jgi:hypothetical protein